MFLCAKDINAFKVQKLELKKHKILVELSLTKLLFLSNLTSLQPNSHKLKSKKSDRICELRSKMWDDSENKEKLIFSV